MWGLVLTALAAPCPKAKWEVHRRGVGSALRQERALWRLLGAAGPAHTDKHFLTPSATDTALNYASSSADANHLRFGSVLQRCYSAGMDAGRGEALLGLRAASPLLRTLPWWLLPGPGCARRLSPLAENLTVRFWGWLWAGRHVAVLFMCLLLPESAWFQISGDRLPAVSSWEGGRHCLPMRELLRDSASWNSWSYYAAFLYKSSPRCLKSTEVLLCILPSLRVVGAEGAQHLLRWGIIRGAQAWENDASGACAAQTLTNLLLDACAMVS